MIFCNPVSLVIPRTTSLAALAVGILTLSLSTCTLTTAKAQTILYDYKTTLTLNSGPDNAGLNGATVDLKVDVNTSSVYITRFGLAAVVMNNDAAFTISGSSMAGNNGMFAMQQLAFYPTAAGLFTEPGGSTPSAILPVGGILSFFLNAIPTAHGSTVIAGNTVSILDFAPTTTINSQWTGSNGTVYNQTNTVISATQTSSVPEPGSIALLAGLAMTGIGFFIRRRK